MQTTWTVPAVIERVVDGDTLILQLDLGWHISFWSRARVAGINAPELPTAEGVAALAYAQSLLPVNALVRFASHALDKYGRPLGAVTLADGRDFAVEMLTAGHAVPYMGG